MSYGGGYGGNSVPPIAPARSSRNGNSPSRNALRNVINVYRLLPSQDEDGAPENTWTLLFSNLRCMVTPDDLVREDRHAAIREITQYRIIIGTNPGCQVGDKVLWVDDLGVTRTISVVGMRSMAGRGAAFHLFGEEVI